MLNQEEISILIAYFKEELGDQRFEISSFFLNIYRKVKQEDM